MTTADGSRRRCLTAVPRWAVIVRTQGRRPGLLAESLASIAAQTLPVFTFLVVHGDSETVGQVRADAARLNQGIEMVHAPDTRRQRGYPLNLALNLIYDAGNPFDFVFFLDDDDIVFPQFAERMTEAFRDSEADVVYAASQKRVPGQVATPGYQPLPIPCLLVGNFMPINSYSIRVGAIREQRVRFDEALEVLEDWNFLHRLLALQLSFQPLADCLSEFRLTGDGNTPVKNDQAMWDRAWASIHRYLDRFWAAADTGCLSRQLDQFNCPGRPPFTPAEADRVRQTWLLLQEQSMASALHAAPEQAMEN